VHCLPNFKVVYITKNKIRFTLRLANSSSLDISKDIVQRFTNKMNRILATDAN